MKIIHRYDVLFYSSGGWLKRITVKASSKDEAIKKTREQHTVIEIHSIRYID